MLRYFVRDSGTLHYEDYSSVLAFVGPVSLVDSDCLKMWDDELLLGIL